MDYYSKYLKYKNKYLALKKNQRGGDNEVLPIGINFESGKIITWETKCKNCIAWANCQIGMDAPYHGRVADESHRTKGRSELNFPGYREDLLINDLENLFEHIKLNYPETKIVIQIARGRAGIQMFDEVIEPVLKLKSINPDKYIIQYGYRTANYYECRDLEEDFVFVNIGMFAVLTEPEKVYVGQLCNPVITYNITNYDDDSKEFAVEETVYNFSSDPKNILNKFGEIQKIKLFGIGDCMKFVTPDIYNESGIDKLIKLANK
jgi:hypothetical protein